MAKRIINVDKMIKEGRGQGIREQFLFLHLRISMVSYICNGNISSIYL